MKLGFDIDEVVCDLLTLMSDYVKEAYEIEWGRDQYTTYGLNNACFVANDLELNTKIIKDLQNVIYNPEFQAAALPFKDAVNSIRQYKKQGHSIHFLTSRKSNKNDVAKWLRKHKIPFDTIHTNLGHKGSIEKGHVGRTLNLDIYIDDLEHHLNSMWKFKKRWRKGLLLMDKPWNQGPYDASKFTKVYNWAEIDRHLGVQNR